MPDTLIQGRSFQKRDWSLSEDVHNVWNLEKKVLDTIFGYFFGIKVKQNHESYIVLISIVL